MKSIYIFFLLLGNLTLAISLHAQNFVPSQADSLKMELTRSKVDSSRALILTQISEAYRVVESDSSYAYANRALELSRKIKYPAGELKALLALTIYYYFKGTLPKALELGLQALEIAKQHDLRSDQAFAMIRIGNVYLQLGDYRKALQYYERTREMTRNTDDSFFHAVTYWVAADAYENMKMTDSAMYMATIAYDTASKMKNRLILSGLNRVMANIYSQQGNDVLALKFFRKALGNFSDTSRNASPEVLN